VARLVVITGPIAAGMNTVASLIADAVAAQGRSAVLIDVDDIAAMVAAPGAAAAGLWFAAHQAHGALVGKWMQTAVDVVSESAVASLDGHPPSPRRHRPRGAMARNMTV
jgi:adenylylsulfate kinase-like enzyme